MVVRAAAVLLVLDVMAARAQQPTVELRDTAVLSAPRLGESSGVTPSRRSGVYWSLNDSGDGPILYATDSAGRDLGHVTVLGAQNIDWEDLSAGPCPRTAGRCLFAGDIGDNSARRSSIFIYAVPEPAPPRQAADTLRGATIEMAFEFRYPDRPHDAEGLAVLSDGRFLLVTKDLFGAPRLYEGSVRSPQRSDTLHFIGTLAMPTSAVTGRIVTGAAVSPDGRILVVRTYVTLHFFRLGGQGVPESIGRIGGIGIPVVEAQGEGVCFDGPDALVLTSERGSRRHAILTRLRVGGLRE
jgi:hypothetical protein